LEKNGLGFNKKQLAAIFLSGLPKKYESTVKTLLANPENLDMPKVKQHFLEEEEEQTNYSLASSHHVGSSAISNTLLYWAL